MKYSCFWFSRGDEQDIRREKKMEKKKMETREKKRGFFERQGGKSLREREREFQTKKMRNKDE
jgi:hypothetical protein